MKALVILSGGQDSTMCLDIAVGFFGASQVKAISFNYGQRHRRELECARDVALYYGVQHEVVDVGPILASTSPLTDTTAELEQYQSYAEMDAIIGNRVEKTFVPMRNALFLTLAANRAVCDGIRYLYTGVCEADNANYPDCRESFIQAQQEAINQALGYPFADPRHIRILTPLMNRSKPKAVAEFFQEPNFAVMALTHTAYDGSYPPVGNDHATVLRAQGFLDAGVPDPLVIRANRESLMLLPDTSNYADQALNSKIAADVARVLAVVHSAKVTA